MPAQSKERNDEGQIRELIEGWTFALRAKDLDGVMSVYAPDALAFDLAPPLQHDTEAVRRGLQTWFSTFTGPIGYDVRDLDVTVGGDVAFSRSLNHLTGKRTNGDDTDVWVRATIAFCKVGGTWKVTHEHVSVPFYMDGSFKAAIDLKP
jgi:ketosteroid isomerase-like protein